MTQVGSDGMEAKWREVFVEQGIVEQDVISKWVSGREQKEISPGWLEPSAAASTARFLRASSPVSAWLTYDLAVSKGQREVCR